jgi:t-SNARE complex subunit (syntaxin)
MEQIESQLAGLSSTFAMMAELVQDQGHIVLRIDENLDSAQDSVESAGESDNPGLVVKIFRALGEALVAIVATFIS